VFVLQVGLVFIWAYELLGGRSNSDRRSSRRNSERRLLDAANENVPHFVEEASR
jgi:hypothetical protein